MKKIKNIIKKSWNEYCDICYMAYFPWTMNENK